MNIKLRARLQAYGKLDISKNVLPEPSVADAGKFVGVGHDGEYVLFANATDSTIDRLFGDEESSNQAKRSLIDSLF